MAGAAHLGDHRVQLCARHSPLGAPFALLDAWTRRAWVVVAWLFHLGVLALMAILFIYPLTGVAFASFGHPEELWQRVRARSRTDHPIGECPDNAYGARRA